ncbi:hypothetical protein E2C01_051320 [Portunus trituberculatus]|uniref:Uncharacterized protein n=1 Tax=Portunus trituberculatus TaxID=210409 RepID=A0A5B7GEF6_PORTR|nr:hypothetical protein [Portunus trituberculatus]
MGLCSASLIVTSWTNLHGYFTFTYGDFPASLPKERLFAEGCSIYGLSVRQSSARVHQAKWSMFCGWCESTGCHLLLASVMD